MKTVCLKIIAVLLLILSTLFFIQRGFVILLCGGFRENNEIIINDDNRENISYLLENNTDCFDEIPNIQNVSKIEYLVLMHKDEVTIHYNDETTYIFYLKYGYKNPLIRHIKNNGYNIYFRSSEFAVHLIKAVIPFTIMVASIVSLIKTKKNIEQRKAIKYRVTQSSTYKIDNDLHIHSKLSLCSDDPGQTTERILKYAEENGLKTICLTDHFWDETVPCESPWYSLQDYDHIKKALPLPENNGIRFLFGCETELDKNLTLGISKEKYDLFDFIIIPVTHFHIDGFVLTDEQAKTPESRAAAWIYRFDAVLNMDLPFHKIGLAHLTCDLMARDRGDYLKIIELLDETEMRRLFIKAAELGVGVELNACDLMFSDEEAETVLRPYRIAKECGCKFYLGSDAHHPAELDSAKKLFEKAIALLDLEEKDKFII